MKNKFLLLAKSDYQKNKRTILTIFIGIVFAFIGFDIYFYTRDIGFGDGASRILLQGICFILISQSFADYQRKSIILNLMLPATKNDKYLYVFIKNIVVIPFLLIVTFLINRGIIFAMMEKDYLFYFSDFRANIALNIVLNGFVFFLSSILFKRAQFVYAIFIIGAMNILFLSNSSPMSIMPYVIKNLNLYYAYALPVIIGVVCYTWFRFKNMQIK